MRITDKGRDNLKKTEIEIKDLSFSYGEKEIFRYFSASIPSNKCSVILAKSGAGKTTLLHLIAGLLCPSGGSIQYPVDHPKFSFVFQENRLLEQQSVRTNLRLANRHITDDELKKALAGAVLSEEMLCKKVRQLSGGEQRRVSILRALLADYDILLLDEPFTGLDDRTKEQMIQFTKEQMAGKTTILVTHNEEEAQALGGGYTLRL